MIATLIKGIIRTWLRAAGRKVRLSEEPWLGGPQGDKKRIGDQYYQEFAQREGFTVSEPAGAGLLSDFPALADEPPSRLNPRISHFYEHTSEYSLDVWSEWSSPIKPFAWLLVRFVSSEMDQLNIPFRPLDASRGMSNRVILMKRGSSKQSELVCWLRKSLLTGRVVYSGFYAAMRVHGRPMVRVVFPVPEGNVTVLLHPEFLPDGSFRLVSKGKEFGGSGYYRVQHCDADHVKVLFLPLHEVIHVYESPDGELRTDHEFRYWGIRYLKLHYRLRRKPEQASTV